MDTRSFFAPAKRTVATVPSRQELRILDQNLLARRKLRLPEVMAVTGMGRSTIYAAIKEGKFPPPVQLYEGSRAVGWPYDHIAPFL